MAVLAPCYIGFGPLGNHVGGVGLYSNGANSSNHMVPRGILLQGNNGARGLDECIVAIGHWRCSGMVGLSTNADSSLPPSCHGGNDADRGACLIECGS